MGTSGNWRWNRRTAALAGLAMAAPLLSLVAAPAAPASATKPPVISVPAPAAEIVPCGTRTTAQPFTAWGDTAEYFTLPGGDFEAPSARWILAGGAARAAGNEPWNVLAATDTHSLALPKGSSAVAPSFCVDPVEPTVRFFYRSPGVPGAKLVVTLRADHGRSSNTSQHWLDGSRPGWVLTPALRLPGVAHAGAGQSTVTITFTQNNVPADWAVDDLEVDPWRPL